MIGLLLGGCGDDAKGDPLPDQCENTDGIDTCAEASFRAFADDTSGDFRQVDTATAVPDAIIELVEEGSKGGSSYDLMFIIDVTGSMADDLAAIRSRLDDLLSTIEEHGNGSERVGILAYRDHCIEEDWYDFMDLTGDFDEVRSQVNALSARGGGDTPESVYEAVEATMTMASWENDNRFALLIGDAGPHYEENRREDCDYTTYDEAVRAASSAGVAVNLYPILVSVF